MTCFLLTITIYFHLPNDRSKKCHIINARGGGGGGGGLVSAAEHVAAKFSQELE